MCVDSTCVVCCVLFLGWWFVFVVDCLLLSVVVFVCCSVLGVCWLLVVGRWLVVVGYWYLLVVC